MQYFSTVKHFSNKIIIIDWQINMAEQKECFGGIVRSPVALSVISFINASDTKAIEAVFPQNEEAVYTVEYIQDDDTTLSS